MFKRLIWIISISLIFFTLGCHKFFSSPEPSNTQPQVGSNSEKSSSGLVGLPLPLASLLKVTQADISELEKGVVLLINEDRRKAGLSPVVWDETAANAARQHVQEEADQGYISHWGMDGEKPQRRYSLAGGLDAVEENESVSLWLQGGFNGLSKAQLQTIVAEHQTAMVNEQPPDDGHRKNILDPHHTGVGIAIAIGKYGVAMAQEFTNDYSNLSALPLNTEAGSTIALRGNIKNGYQITGIYGIWEQLPIPMTTEQLMQTHSYSNPSWDNLHFYAKPNGKNYYITTPSGNVFAKNVSVDQKGYFSISIPLYKSHALDYITVEIAPSNDLKDTFYAAQIVIKH